MYRNINNIVNLLNGRESNASERLRLKYQFTAPLLQRLSLEQTLEGHQGCVNCLEWNSDGRILASGSDDTNVRFWDPFRNKCLNMIQTSHIGNIFSVKFLGDGSLIATGAGDCRVIVQPIHETKNTTPYVDCGCHLGRVKRLARCPDQPLLFWSAGEDGLIFQYDIRESHKCTVKSKIFIDLSNTNELKCITVNPTRPHLLAVGANDCYVRLYDRRMVKTTKYHMTQPGEGWNYELNHRKRPPPEPQDAGCVQYYAPGHLTKEMVKDYSSKYVTYVEFNAAGTELLVNVGGEHIYLFDINNQRPVEEMTVPKELTNENDCPVDSEGDVVDSFTDKATKLVHRNWTGDIYHAARYFLCAMRERPKDRKLYLSFINCMIQLKWWKEAEGWLEIYKATFPSEDSDELQVIHDSIQLLRTDVNKETENVREAAVSDNPPETDKIEKELRQKSRDFELRFVGHCNTTTDIKEATFLGNEGNFICAGSDDGLIFIWDRKTTEVLTAISGDNSIVNCVLPHPSACLLASSGIESAVKIWTPYREDGSENPHMIWEPSHMIELNQRRMCMDPFEIMLMDMGYRVRTLNADTSNPPRLCTPI